MSLTYDALTRMVEQNRASVYTQVVYAPTGEKFALMSGQTLQKAYVPLPGKLTAVYTSAGFSYYRHKDWLGSSRFASTATLSTTAGMGTSTVNGSEQSKVAAPATPGMGSATLSGTEQSTAGGPGTPGTGTVTIGGFEQSKFVCDPTIPGCSQCRLRSCGVTVWDNGTVFVTVNGFTKSTGYGQRSDSSAIASGLAAAFNADSASPVSATVNGSVITLTAKTVGTATNYSISASVSWNKTNFASASFSGTPSGSTLTGGTNSTQVFDNGTVWVTVNGCQVTAPYQQGSTAGAVASALNTAINSSACSPVNSSLSNLTVVLTAKTPGAGTNYGLSSGSSTSQPGTFSHPSFTVAVSGAALTGGQDAIVTYDTGTAWIAVNGVSTPVSYGQNDTVLTLANSLKIAINANTSSPVNASLAGSLLVLTAKTTGAATNYSLSAGSSTSQPATFTSPSFTVAVSGSALTGGSASAASMYSSTAYAPFGETYAQAGTSDASFAGLNQDTTGGLYDADAREYSTQGRWPSPDPAGSSSMHLTDPQTLNRYAYSRNNPVSLSDPSGLDWCDWFGGCDGGGFGGGSGCDWDPSCFGGGLPNPFGGLPDPFGISKYPLPGTGCDWGCLDGSSGSGSGDEGPLDPFNNNCQQSGDRGLHGKNHNARDFKAPDGLGSDIYAADDGIISSARTGQRHVPEPPGGYDLKHHPNPGPNQLPNQINLKTNDGYQVNYAHATIDDGLAAGDPVKRGDHIGVADNSGRTTGPHGHTTVTDKQGKPVDPLDYFACGGN